MSFAEFDSGFSNKPQKAIDYICLVYRAHAQVGNVPLHDGLVFFWSSCLAIVGCEFGKIRTGDDDRNVAVSRARLLALRIGTKRLVFLPSCSIVIETSVHVPTRSLAVVCAADSSLGRKTPKISADAVRTAEMMRFIVLLLAVGGCSRALAMERALRGRSISQFQLGHTFVRFMFSGRYS